MKSLIYLCLIFLPLNGCSWIASDAGRYCYCEVDADDCSSIKLEYEYSNSESASEKTAEVPAL